MKPAFTVIFVSILLSGCLSISNFDKGSFIPVNDEPVEIDFEVLSDLIIVKAEINGVSGRFLYDNGFSLSAVNQEFADRAHIDFNNSSNIRDANNGQANVPETTVDSVAINGQLFVKTGFYNIDTAAFLPCDSIDGIIGASIINKANWKINFEEKKIQISSVPFKGKGNKLPISISNNNSSFTTISIQGIPYKCKIDLGNTTSIKISKNDIANSMASLPAEKRIGIMSMSSNGLGRIDSIYHIACNLPLINSQDTLPVQSRVLIKDKLKYQGYIGVNYFNKYESIIINSTNKEYILLKPKEITPAEIESSYGIALYYLKGAWRIIQIDSYDSELSKIELMDEVITLDYLPIARFKNTCDYREYLKVKMDKKESLVISLKNSPSIELPYRRNKIQETPIYNKK